MGGRQTQGYDNARYVALVFHKLFVSFFLLFSPNVRKLTWSFSSNYPSIEISSFSVVQPQTS